MAVEMASPWSDPTNATSGIPRYGRTAAFQELIVLEDRCRQQEGSLDRLPPIRQLQDSCLAALTQIRDEVQELFSGRELDRSAATATLKSLFWYLGSRGQAVSFLICNDFGWDAEIILRSYYETAAKIMFICTAAEADKNRLVEEFWNRSTSDGRTARKAAEAEKALPNDHFSKVVFQALQDGDLFDLSVCGSKAQRKRLEQKWSFSEIMEELERRASAGVPLRGIRSFLHIYGLASHLIHADAAAMDLMRDRATRPGEERAIVADAHAARIMSDQVHVAWLCAESLRTHFSAKFSDPERLFSVVRSMQALSRPFESAFEESRRAFYARYDDGG